MLSCFTSSLCYGSHNVRIRLDEAAEGVLTRGCPIRAEGVPNRGALSAAALPGNYRNYYKNNIYILTMTRY